MNNLTILTRRWLFFLILFITIVGEQIAANIALAENIAAATVNIDEAIAADTSQNNKLLDQCILQFKNSTHIKTNKNNDAADRYNKDGLTKLDGKNFSGAAEAFKLAAEKDPTDPKFLSNLGYAELHSGHFQQAEKLLYQSIVLDPTRSVAWGNLGETFAHTGDREKAISCFLIGYKVSGGKTADYLLWLAKDDNDTVRSAGAEALKRTQSHIESKSKEVVETNDLFKRDPKLSLPQEKPWRLSPVESTNHVNLSGLNSFCPADFQPYTGVQFFKNFKLGMSFRAFKNTAWADDPAAIMTLVPNEQHEVVLPNDVTYALLGQIFGGNRLAPVRFVFTLDHGVFISAAASES
jgi:tetratricopeptide (TPR) repeat protein